MYIFGDLGGLARENTRPEIISDAFWTRKSNMCITIYYTFSKIPNGGKGSYASQNKDESELKLTWVNSLPEVNWAWIKASNIGYNYTITIAICHIHVKENGFSEPVFYVDTQNSL